MQCIPTDSPVATISEDRLNLFSSCLHSNVVVEEGYKSPHFICSGGDTSPVATSLWGGQNGHVAFPSGVAQIQRSQISELQWRRAVETTDSGNYTCYAENSVGVSSILLVLQVRRKSPSSPPSRPLQIYNLSISGGSQCFSEANGNVAQLYSEY